MRQLLTATVAAAAVLAPACVQAEDLSDAIALAYTTNPTLQAQRAAVRALDETYVQAKAGMGPTVSAGLNVAGRSDRTESGPTFFSGPATTTTEGYSNGASATINQPLLTGGRVQAEVDSAKAAVMAGRATLSQTEQQVLADTITAYVQVLRDQQSLQVFSDNLDVVQRQANDTEARFQSREDTATDRAEAQSRVASAQADLETARGQLALSRVQYLAVVGQNPGTLSPLPDLQGIPASLDEALAIAAKTNPALQAAQFNRMSAQADLARAKSAYLPTLALSVTGSIASTSPYNNDMRTEDVTGRLTLTQPIFASGLNASRIRQADQRVQQTGDLVNAADRSAAQAVGRSWAQADSLRRLLTINVQRVNALRLAYEGVRAEQQLGNRSTIEVLNQAQELQIARSTLVQAQANEYITRVNLLQAMGILDTPHVAPDVDVYDPAAHFNQVKNKGGFLYTPLIQAMDALVASVVSDRPIPPDPARGAKPLINATLPPAPNPAAPVP